MGQLELRPAPEWRPGSGEREGREVIRVVNLPKCVPELGCSSANDFVVRSVPYGNVEQMISACPSSGVVPRTILLGTTCPMATLSKWSV